MTATVDRVAAGAAAAVATFLAARFWMYAGALWRDEVDTVNLSRLPAATLWSWLDRISLPPAYPMLLGLWSSRDFGNDDGALRTLGLVTALATFAALWLVGQRVTGRPPALALALYGTNAVAVHTSASLTVYAPGVLLVVLAFGAVWALASTPSARTLVVACVTAVLAVQLQYQNVMPVGAIAVAGAAASAVAGWRRASLLPLVVLAFAALSLAPYRAIVERSMVWRVVSRNPVDTTSPLSRLAEVLSAGSMPSLIVWAAIAVLAGYGLARVRWTSSEEPLRATRASVTFAVGVVVIAAGSVLGIFGAVGPVAMARHLVALVALGALGLDVAVSRLCPRWTRLAAVAAIVVVATPVATTQLGLRVTSVDLVSRHLEAAARPGDLIVVNPWFVGLTFDRYYRGPVAWTSVPPLPTLRHHLYDTLRERMMSPAPLTPLFADIARALEGGGRVWFVGPPAFLPPGQPVPVLPPAPGTPTKWFDVPYLVTWSMQTGDFVRRHALRWQQAPIPSDRAVSPMENPSVLMVEGWAK